MIRVATAVALVALAACGSGERPSMTDTADSLAAASRSPLTALLTDSAHADSIALATLPPRQRHDFAMDELLAAAARGDTAIARCEPLSQPTEPELRIRMRARDRGNLAVVLFARADRTSGELRRVELARRTSDGGQVGYTWDADASALTALEWAPGQREPVQYEMPAGTPTPRALRGLGRRLLVTCLPAAAELGAGAETKR